MPATELIEETTALDQLLPLGDQLTKRLEELHRQIEQRAYDIFIGSGFTDGHDLDHWLQAESEVLQSAPLDIQESDSEYIVRMKVLGFEEKEIEVAAYPDRVLVSAQHDSESQQKTDKSQTTEVQSRSIWRSFSLSPGIDPSHIAKHLQDMCSASRAAGCFTSSVMLRLPRLSQTKKLDWPWTALS